jgi:nitrogen fixation NifU-like protein
MNDLANSDLRDLYQDLILDHGKHPRNFRAVENANREALGHNPLCGDRLTLHLRVDSHNIIRDVGFQGSGCAISMASSSMMTEMLMNKSVHDAEQLFHFAHNLCTGHDSAAPETLPEDDRDRLGALSGVRHYPMRVKCATLAWHTLDAALKNTETVSTE